MSGTNMANNRNTIGKIAKIFLNEKYLIYLALKESQHLLLILNNMLLMKTILGFKDFFSDR